MRRLYAAGNTMLAGVRRAEEPLHLKRHHKSTVDGEVCEVDP